MMMGNGGNDMMGMMAKMMGGDSDTDDKQSEMNPDAFMEMCFNGPMMMMKNMPKEKRIEYIPKFIIGMLEKGCDDLSAEEKKGMLNSVLETIK